MDGSFPARIGKIIRAIIQTDDQLDLAAPLSEPIGQKTIMLGDQCSVFAPNEKAIPGLTDTRQRNIE
jgi:hypothetical protein